MPVQCNTLFDLASNTKMYATNYAVMHLVAESKLDVNKPISFTFLSIKVVIRMGNVMKLEPFVIYSLIALVIHLVHNFIIHKLSRNMEIICIHKIALPQNQLF